MAFLSKRHRRARLVVAALAISGCTPSTSQPSATPFLEEPAGSSFEQIDRNRDGFLEFPAFHRGMTVHYYFRQGLDLDGDDIIRHVELTTALFELWDADDDGSLSPGELSIGMNAFLPDDDAGARFLAWDRDANGALSMIELGEGTLSLSSFELYDGNADGVIETIELSRYLFRRWDANGNDRIERSEWPLP